MNVWKTSYRNSWSTFDGTPRGISECVPGNIFQKIPGIFFLSNVIHESVEHFPDDFLKEFMEE